MRWMMRIMRLTLLARSEMISMFDGGYAARCAVLRNQRTQDRHELRGAHVTHRDHLRDDLVGGRR